MAKRRTADRRTRGFAERRVNIREPIQRFLIDCEGSKTEPNYFAELRKDHRLNATVKLLGLGLDPSQLVEAVLTERQRNDYDQAWCVFDRDSWPAQNFNSALALAKRHEIRIAYSNEAFELWYLLHFNYYDTALSRQQYVSKLDALLSHPYAKNSPVTYHELRSRQEEALRNARALLGHYNPRDPANDNPSTTVHLLIEELLRFAR